MDIKSWKIMLAVDDYGSFTRVGAELGYTQSGITQMMKNLEKKVGFRSTSKTTTVLHLQMKQSHLFQQSAHY